VDSACSIDVVPSPASSTAVKNTFKMSVVNLHVLRVFPFRLDTLCNYVTNHVNELNPYLSNVELKSKT